MVVGVHSFYSRRLLRALALSLLPWCVSCGSTSPTTPEPLPPPPVMPATVSTGTLARSVQGVGIAVTTVFVFSAQGFSSSDGGALTYRWDFGDGHSTAAGSSVSHVYGGPGLFDVQVLVTNAAGRTAEASLAGIQVATLTGRWGGQLPVTSRGFITTFDMHQDGTSIRGVSNFWDEGQTALAGRLTDPKHLELTLTVRPGKGGITTPLSLPFSLDGDAQLDALTGTLSYSPFCPCTVTLTRQLPATASEVVQ